MGLFLKLIWLIDRNRVTNHLHAKVKNRISSEIRRKVSAKKITMKISTATNPSLKSIDNRKMRRSHANIATTRFSNGEWMKRGASCGTSIRIPKTFCTAMPYCVEKIHFRLPKGGKP